MNETDASRVLLIRALETEDKHGNLLPEALRRRIARDVGPPPVAGPDRTALGPEQQAFLLRRARAALESLGRAWQTLPPAFAATPRAASRLFLVLPLAAFVAGAAFQDLGRGNGINILAFPLLGLLLWNLVVYALLAVRPLYVAPAGMPRGLRRLLARQLAPGMAGAATDALQARTLARFATDWMELGAPLALSRAAALLHLSAALLAAGAVAGMYLRGLAFEYRAGWESTFLDAETVGRIVGTVLAPAAALTGLELPRGEQWQSLRFGPGQPGENASRWIHLYAATTASLAVLPRLMLAWSAWRRARRLAADFSLPPRDDPYFSRLLAAATGAPPRIVVVCYSYHLPEPARQGLEQRLGQSLADGLRLPQPEVIDYGAEDEYLERLAALTSTPADWLILVFSVAATPEHETHGRLCDGLAQHVAAGRGARRLLVLVDESAYRERLGGEAGAGKRLAQRRQAWRVALDGHDFVISDLTAPGDSDSGFRDALTQAARLPA